MLAAVVLLVQLLGLFSLVSLNDFLVSLLVLVLLAGNDDVDPLVGVLVDWFNVDGLLVAQAGWVSVVVVDNSSVN